MTVSRHFLRRRARARAALLRRAEQLREPEHRHEYEVVRATRGPFRWFVVQH